jgi:hypothetical protein
VIREDENQAFCIDTFRLMIYGALALSWMVPELLDMFKGILCNYSFGELMENCRIPIFRRIAHFGHFETCLQIRHPSIDQTLRRTTHFGPENISAQFGNGAIG